MKKLLCFAMILCIAVCELYAQTPCIRFVQPNLYPQPGVTQSINIYFNNAGLDNNGKYAITYDLYRNDELISDVEIGDFLNMAQTAILVPLTTNTNYNGQYVTSASGVFPSGYFEAGGNISQYNFNYLNGAYLNSQDVHIQMRLAWRSDRTFTDDSYMLVIKLVSMSGGTPQQNINYNMRGAQVGGYGATAGVTLLTDTITTIKYVDEVIKDTICYSQLPYSLGRTTITVGQGDLQPAGSDFYSIVEEEVTFGKPLNDYHCNERIDSIATVKFYVRPELTLTNVGTGNNLIICDYSTAGYVRVQPVGGNAPYTVYAYLNDGGTYATEATGSVTISTSEGIDTIKGLGVGSYKLVCVDAAGCEATDGTDAVIAAADVPNTYTITGTITHIICNGGETGKIESVEATLNDGGTEATPLTYTWSGPDEYSNNGQAITSLKAGNYTVTVTDRRGCVSEKEFKVEENAAIESTDAVSICASQLPYQHGDTIFSLDEIGESGQIQKVVHFASALGCDSAVTVTVTIHENPTVDWGNTPNSVCIGQPITASVNGTSAYLWTQDGEILPNATSNTEEITWFEAGQKTISVNFSDENGCRVVSDTTMTITVNPLPDATITTTVAGTTASMFITACAGQTVTLSAKEDYVYSWKKENETEPVGSEQTLTLSNISDNEAGKYVVELLNETTGCSTTSDTVTIEVNTPTILLTPMDDQTICNYSATTVTVLPKAESNYNEISYTWNNNSSLNEDYIDIPANTLTDTTTYTVVVTATIGDCSVSAYDTVVVNVNNPSVTLTPMLDQTICNGNSATLTANVNSDYKGELSYTWKDMEETAAEITVEPDATTTYYLTVTATVGEGDDICIAEAKDTVIVTVNDPKVTLTPMSDQTLCAATGTPTAELSIYATAENGSELTYAWTNNKGLTITDANAATATAHPTDTTEFYVVVTATIGECSVEAKDTMVVNVNTPSVTLGQMEDQTVCYEEEGETGAELTAIVSNSRGTLSYDWSSNMNASFAEMEEGLVWADLQDTTTIYLAVTAALDINADMTCRFTAYDTVVVNVNHPGVTLTPMTDQTICKEETTNANLSITATPVNGSTLTYAWTNNKSATFSDATIANPVATLTDTTEFYVEVTATIGDCSFTAYDTVVVNVNAPAIVIAIEEPDAICLGESTDLEVSVNNDESNYEDLSFLWSSGNEDDVETVTPTLTAHEYTVTVTASIGSCSATASASVSVTVNDTVKLSVTNKEQTICANETDITPAVITVENATVEVTNLPDGVTFDGTNTISGRPTAAGNYNIFITATSNQTPACTAKTDTVKLTVNPTVVLTGTADTTFAMCLGTSVASQGLPFSVQNASYTIEGLPAGINYSANGFYGSPTTAGVFHYTVTATSDQTPACDSKTITGTITVKDTVKYTVSGDLTQILCWENMGDTVTLTVENATITPTATGLGTLAGTNSLKVFRDENTAIGTHPFSISIESTNECNLTNKIVEGSIKVNDTVRFTISGDTTFTVCVGSAIDPVMISVENAATGMGIDGIMIEDLPAGLTFTSDEGIHGNPEEVGTFHYTVESRNRFMSNGRGCPGRTFTGTITVNDTVKLAVTGDTTQTKCLGEALTDISFAVENGTGALTWENNAPAGVTQSETGISGTPTEYGTFRYTYNATSTTNCPNSDKTITGTLTINDTIKLDATNTKQEICLGTTITPIEITSANSEVMVSFDNDDNNGLTYQGGVISGTPTAARNIYYTITASSTNNCGDPKVITDTIVVNDTTVTLTVSAPGILSLQHPGEYQYSVCSDASETNDTVTFTTAADMTNYVWNVDGGTIISGENTNAIQAQWATSGQKNITVAYTNEHGCSGTSASTAITVFGAPTFTVAGSDADNRICIDATDTLTITATNPLPGVHYNWTPETGLTSISETKKVLEGDDLTFGEYAYAIVATRSAIRNNGGDKTCQVTNNITITVDTLPSVTLTKTDPLCYNSEDGSAIATTADAVTNYSFIWNNEVNTSYNTGISAIEDEETYTVTVTDNRTGCTVTKDITLVNPDEIELTKSEHVNVMCYGDATGSFKVSATGGTPFTGNTYQFILNNDGSDNRATDSTFSNLLKGYYTVTVLDKNGCSAEIMDTIKEPSAPLAVSQIDSTNISCNGKNNGQIWVHVVGGTPENNGGAPYYNYEWEGPTGCNIDNHNNPAHAFGLIAGRYTIHITDALGCSLDTAVTLTEPDELTITSFATDSVKCKEGEDGKITVNVTGGTLPYQYSLDNEEYQDENIFDGLSAGEYTIYVKDAKNCSVSKDTVIYEPAALAVAIDSTDITCYDGENGSIALTVTGGTGAYNYAWTGPNGYTGNAASIETLKAGRYTVQITDANNCTLDTAVTLVQPEELTITVDNYSDITCHGLNNGTIIVSSEGGTGDHVYSLNDGTFTGTHQWMYQLGENDYTITVKDDNGCTASTDPIHIANPAEMIVKHTSTNLSCYNDNSGSITLTVEGGTPNEEEPYYTYLWNDASTDKDREGLAAGTYSVIVQDMNQCKAYDTIKLEQPDQFAIAINEVENEICAGDSKHFTTTLTINNQTSASTTGYTFQWYKDDVAITDSTNTGITVTEEANYKIVATQTASNCTQGAEIDLDVYDLPTVTITADPKDSICAGATATLTCSGNAEEYTWATVGEWGNNASASIGTTETSYTVTGIIPGRYVVSATGEDQHDYVACSTTAYDTITVMALPEVAIVTGTRDTMCGTETMTLEATGANSYEWSGDGITGDNNTATFVDPTANYGTESNTYNVAVSVEGTDLFGCKATGYDTITVNLLPVAYVEALVNDNIAGNTIELCEGGRIQLAAADQYYSGDYSHAWYHVGTETAVSTEESYLMNNVTTANNGKYVLVVTNDATGCSKTSDTITVKVNELPEVAIVTGPRDTMCGAETMILEATGANTYEWSGDGVTVNNDNNTATFVDPTIDYGTSTNTYNVVVSVEGTDLFGCKATAYDTITVNWLPEAYVKVAVNGNNSPSRSVELCEGGNIQLSTENQTYSGSYTHAWYHVGTTDAVSNQTSYEMTDVTTDANGKYVLVVTNNATGCSKTSDTVTVTVNELPTVKVNDPSMCRGGSVALTADGAASYAWAPADSLDNNAGASVNFHSAAAGTFNIIVTGTDDHQCVNTDTATVTVNDLPTIGIPTLGGRSHICEGDTTRLDVGNDFETYTWTTTGGELDHNDTRAVIFTGTTASATAYTVTAVIEDANGCTNSAATEIYVDTLPVPTITADNDVCMNGDIKFTTEVGNDIATDSYVWTFDGTKVDSVTAVLTLKWDAIGEKTVTVNYTDGNGCTATTPTSKTIKVHVLPEVTITQAPEAYVCLGKDIVLEATSNMENTTFEWANGVNGSEVASVAPDKDSLFIVTGTYQPVDGLSCYSNDTVLVKVKDTVKLIATNPTLLSQEFCLGEDMKDIVLDTANCTLAFEPELSTKGLAFDPATATISGTPTEAETFTVTITAESTVGCESRELSFTLTVNDTNKLAFTTTNTEQSICLGQSIEGIVLDTANCTLAFEPELNTMNLVFDPATATISGTPEEATTLTFTISATPINSGCNNEKTLKFTIGVKDTNILEIASENGEQEICLGEAIEDILLDTANCTLTFEPALSTMNLEFDPATAIISGTPEEATTKTFTITATPTNENCYDTKTIEFVIKVNDTVALTATGDLDQKICLGESIETVKFTVANGELSIMDGTTLDDVQLNSTDSTLTGTPTAATTGHTIKVQATNTACPLTNKTIEVKVVVDTIPAVEITADDATICPNGQQSATLTATAGYATYTWSTDDTEGTNNTLTVTPEEETTYTVTVKNGEGCTASNTINITLHTLPEITISGNDAICLGQSTVLTAETDEDHTALSYEWLGVTAESADINFVSVTPVADSTFRVRVVDVEGCYDTAKIDVTVHTLPVVDLAPKSDNVCQNGTIELSSANTGSDITYLWKDATDSVFNDRVYTFVPDTNTLAGVHKISVQLTDGNGCVNSDTAEVNVKLIPILTEAHNRVRCYSEKTAFIDLNVHFNGGTAISDNSYSWTDGDAFTSSDEDINTLRAGSYTVTVTYEGCSAEMTVEIEQPDTLTALLSAPGHELCSGTMDLTVTPTGGNGGFSYVWTSDDVAGTSTTENTLTLDGSTLTAGTHEYSVRVMDDSNCVATAVIATGSTDTIWTISSERLEVNRDINLGPDETYTHEGYTYGLSTDDNGKTFEVNAGAGSGGCDSVIIYTVHMYGIGMHFTDNTYNQQRSSYFHNYSFQPNVTFDTINTSTDVDNEFYAYVTSISDSIDGKHVDMKYEILFNDSPISNDEFSDYVTNLKMSSFYDHDGRFYGIPRLDSARGEMPATTFLYQFPSNSTPYYFDYFNFGAFRNMPQKIEFNFAEPGVYTIKFTVEERVNSTTGNWWGLYNPSVVNGGRGPVWGGRNDEYDGKQTLTARNMTVIVGGAGTTTSNPIVTSIDNYANNTVPTVTTYPNPARDLLNLNISGMEGNTRITITDATGKLVAVYNENLMGSESTLTYDIANFAQGIYFLNVYNNETILTNKFIVTK